MEDSKPARKFVNCSPLQKSKTISEPSSPFSIVTRAIPYSGEDSPSKLEDARIIQRTLVYIINLPLSVSNEAMLVSSQYFGKYGKVLKVHINQAHHNALDPTFGAYLTYSTEEEAAVCIRTCNDFWLDGKKLTVTFGTTKYCSFFLKSMKCPKPECMFLHYKALPEDTVFRKEMVNTRHIQPTDSIFDRLKVVVSPPIPPSKLPEFFIQRDRAVSEIIQNHVKRERIYSNHFETSRYQFTLDTDADLVEVPHFFERLRNYASPCKDIAIVPSNDIKDLLSPSSPLKWARDIFDVRFDDKDAFILTKKKIRQSL